MVPPQLLARFRRFLGVLRESSKRLYEALISTTGGEGQLISRSARKNIHCEANITTDCYISMKARCGGMVGRKSTRGRRRLTIHAGFAIVTKRLDVPFQLCSEWGWK
jgi:hypothetical protein